MATPDTTQTYSAEAARTTILHWARRLPEFPRDVLERRSLLWNFFRRDLLGRFHGSLLGIFWVLIQPLFLFVVYFAIFGILFADPKKLAAGGPDPAFAIYLFAGILSFGMITESTSQALMSVVANGNLVKKVKFPCELLPLVPALVATAVYLVGCVVLIGAGLLTGQVHLTWSLAWWPAFIVCQLGFAVGFGMLLAGANVFVRDVGHVYRIVTQAWFFLSPIFWSLDMMRTKFDPWVANVLMLNPAFPFALAQRQVFGITGYPTDPAAHAAAFPTSLPMNILLAALWAAAFLFGYGFFKSRRHKFADLV